MHNRVTRHRRVQVASTGLNVPPKIILVLILVLLATLAFSTLHAGQAQEAKAQEATQDGRFPLVMPWDDGSKTLTDVSFLNPAPITEKHRVVVKDGHFFDQTARRVRFLGTNFGAGANFPAQADAPKIAARLHKLGFNIVRLHHMDAPWGNPNIFGRDRDNYKLPNEEVSPESLDRLDYLVYELKQHGIYVDLNLHVAWSPKAAQGFPDTEKIPEMGKTTAYFEQRSLEHQKNYARQILTHVNPYTKLRWSDDPAVALIEITNEDTIVGQGWGDTLLDLPPYYRDQLQAKWNTFLKSKYAGTEKMKHAWTGGQQPGPNILKNARFEQNTQGWTLERQQGQFEWSVEDITPDNPSTQNQTQNPNQNGGNAPQGTAPQGRAVHLKISELGDASWRQQFHHSGLDFDNGAIYTIEFWAKADKARRLPVYVGYEQEPWTHIGGDHTFEIGTGWKRYRYVMTAQNPRPNRNRLAFILGEAVGQVWIADVSVRRGFVVELEPGQSLEAGKVSLVRAGDTPQGRDFLAFLVEVEREYSEGMRSYIRQELGAKGLVTCSQAWLGGLTGVLRESRMDWIDMHAYWQHPEFPNKPWDPKDWRTPNTAMVREFGGGTVPHLAMHRVEGKPFTVTEYNHPAPNDYASETMPLICAYAARQDWDGIFLFSYHGDDENWNVNKIRGFFDADTDPNKMATMPAAALLFLGGKVPAVAGRQSTLLVPRDSVIDLTTRAGLAGFWSSNMSGLWNGAGATRRDFLGSRMAVRWVDGQGPVRLQRELALHRSSDALDWRTDSPGTALFTVDTPHAKAVIGFLGQQWLDLEGMMIAMDKTPRNFVTLVLAPRDNRPIAQSQSLLLTALSNVENQGMKWNDNRTSVGDQWGSGPTLAEGIPASIVLQISARSAEVYALDATGRRAAQVPATLKDNRLSFRISPQYKTLWYHIKIEPASVGTTR